MWIALDKQPGTASRSVLHDWLNQ